jgi:NAD(P)-dependent dehydrogenase (short-subunit alcohol dehydrogenase family)
MEGVVMAERFAGKTVFITGASSGIGAELGRQFAREGANVVMTARRKDKLEEVCGPIVAGGGRALPIECDVTDRDSIERAVAETVAAFGGIDVVVANAGFGVNGMFESLTADDFRRQFDTNVFGVLDTIYATLPHLLESKGRLGIVSSVMGRFGAPTSSAYCASKFALCGLAESLFYEFAEKGVSVTCINPGVVESNIRMVDNQNRWKQGRVDPAPAWLCVPAEKACRDIVNALYNRRFEAVITGHGKLITFLTRHFPRAFRFAMRRATKGRLDKLGQRKRAKDSAAADLPTEE